MQLAKKKAAERTQKACNVPKVESIPFTVSDKVLEHIETAFTNVDKLVDRLELNCFTFDSFGKDFIKTQKLSPDSFIQMAIQYTFFRMHQVPGAHYESASLRKFIHGRTETIRSCSVESVEFAKTMLDRSKSDIDKAKLLRAAIDGHKKYTVNALHGYGCDRHLLGLKLLAIENNMDLPELFLDAAFKRSTRMRLSTSQVASRCNGFMVYAPLVSDGYGCCYNPRDRDINFGTSAFTDEIKTSAAKFGEMLQASLMDMHNVLVKTQQAKL